MYPLTLIYLRHAVDAPAEGADYFYYDRYRPPKFLRVDLEPVSADPPPL